MRRDIYINFFMSQAFVFHSISRSFGMLRRTLVILNINQQNAERLKHNAKKAFSVKPAALSFAAQECDATMFNRITAAGLPKKILRIKNYTPD